jgi:serine/threonine protein kinase
VVTQQDTIGGYTLVRRLGQGGMGAVWEAEHLESGRRVALKVLSPNLAATEETIERFLREARMAAALSHPRSTFVFGAGEHDRQPFIVMELMPGRNLQDVLDEEGPLPVTRAVDYTLDVIEGLEAAHALGVWG